MALFLEQIEREGNVMRRKRRAVVKPRFGPQRKVESVAVLRDGHALGQKAVDGIRLVERAGHQRVVDKAPCEAAHRPWPRTCSAC